MPASPTQRTLALLRKQNWTAQVVERWQAQARKRIDLFGCIDILAMRGGVLLGVQATSTSNVPAHVNKSREIPALREWLLTGAMFEVWGWSKKGKAGKTKHWTLDRVIFTGGSAPAPHFPDSLIRCEEFLDA